MYYLKIGISTIPDYEQFGQKTNLRLNPNHIPDLQWMLTDKLHTTSIGTVPKMQNEQADDINSIDEVNIHYIYSVVIYNAK